MPDKVLIIAIWNRIQFIKKRRSSCSCVILAADFRVYYDYSVSLKADFSCHYTQSVCTSRAYNNVKRAYVRVISKLPLGGPVPYRLLYCIDPYSSGLLAETYTVEFQVTAVV